MAQEFVYTNETASRNAQCKVIIYQWKNQLKDPEMSDTLLSKSNRLDVSSQITSVTFSKNMGSPAGSFSFTLTNSPDLGTNQKGEFLGSQDWKDIIKRGFWCLILMSNDGGMRLKSKVSTNPPSKGEVSKYLRGICYIDRAAVKSTVGESGDIDMTFDVSGRDFGVVYEETTIWHNAFRYETAMLDSIKTAELPVTGNVRVNQAIKLIHDLFYFPLNLKGAKVNDNKSLFEIGLQWLLPREMLVDLGFPLTSLSKGTYWGALPNIKDIQDTECGISVEQPADFLSGNAWQQLKKLSIPQLHELFCETRDNGTPRLVFRPIPWSINNSKYPTVSANGKIALYKDLKPVVKVPAIDLIEFDLAEDDHNRYNSFFATISSGLINTEDNISLLEGSDFPKHNHASIRRHGFRPMHVTVDSIVKNEELANGSANRRDLIEFNEVLYDYWNPAIASESGSITKIGTNNVKIGKCMTFNNDVPYLVNKRYYIEGYTDTFVVNENGSTEWTQQIALTRGFETADLQKKSGFLNRNEPFTKPGEYTPGGTNGDDE